jgi:hypothetical protein
MQYMLIHLESEQAFADRQGTPRTPEYWAGWMAYIEAMQQAGVLRSGNPLQPPSTSTTVTLRDGQRHVQDGPWIHSKEGLGGYSVIEVDDLDAALEWAARCPCATDGAVEVRPVLQRSM